MPNPRTAWTSSALIVFGAIVAHAAQTPAPAPPPHQPDHMERHFDNAEKWAKEFDDPARDAWQMPDAWSPRSGSSLASRSRT